MKDVILTGLRANNSLHLGNYLGALLPMLDIVQQKAGEFRVQLFVPDLHSFTTPIDHQQLRQQVLQTVKTYIALGYPVDHEDVFVYRQSYIPPHSEMAWILSCFTGFGEMHRMTQFKEKSATSKEERASVGLFAYPILMATDILLYDAMYVPVGDDQTQHLEFTRDIAERINATFGPVFTVPEPVAKQHKFFGKDQGLRIRDLVDPQKKMSKSDATGKGVIFLTDSPETAVKKIMSATTDSLEDVQYDYQTRPGVSNLLDILRLLGGQPEQFIGQNQYGPLKQAVAERVADFLASFQSNMNTVDNDRIEALLKQSEAVMQQVAVEKLYLLQQAVGLRPKS